jgi:DNA-binding transcriptional MocR family regulator
LSRFIKAAIHEGRLRAGDRLPPIRQLADELGISVTTVAATFDHLSEQKLVRAEVGRGTFVTAVSAHPSPADRGDGWPRTPPLKLPVRHLGSMPWRRRALMSQGTKLRARYPDALDCSTGRPDVKLLPLGVLQRAGTAALQHVKATDLQYAGPEVLDVLAPPLVSLMNQDRLNVSAEDLLIGSSAQQWMMLALEATARVSGNDHPIVAVEEPGYPTIMDAYERAGAKLIPVAIDRYGAVPESLDAAFRGGAMMALLSPRGHNPTGATWSTERRTALAAVMADHPQVLAVEDDQFADGSTTRPGSLLNEAWIGDRVIYVRSFSKLLAPDLRIAATAARTRLRAVLAECKSFADGWASRLLQRTLAYVLTDPDLPGLLRHATEQYGQRRAQAAKAINAVLEAHGGSTWCGVDGVNLWVYLPPDTDALEVAERAAAVGVRIASGEPFFIRPGHTNVVRFGAGSAPTDSAFDIGRILGEAVLASRSAHHGLIHV